jgi:hypothetical protein
VTGRGQVLSLRQGPPCKASQVPGGAYDHCGFCPGSHCLIVQEEVTPALRVAQSSLPDNPEQRWKTVIPVVADLKVKARKLGLWNLFLSKRHYPKHGVDLTNLEVSTVSCSSRTLLTFVTSTLSWQKSWDAVDSLGLRYTTALPLILVTWVRYA